MNDDLETKLFIQGKTINKYEQDIIDLEKNLQSLQEELNEKEIKHSEAKANIDELTQLLKNKIARNSEKENLRENQNILGN